MENRIIIAIGLLFLLLTAAHAQNAQTLPFKLLSPDKTNELTVALDEEGAVVHTIARRGRELIMASRAR